MIKKKLDFLTISIKTMKNIFVFAFIAFLSVPAFTQGNLCESSYMPFKEGISLEYTNYDKKGKEIGKQRQTVSKIESLDEGFSATLGTEQLDKKGKTISEGEFEIICDGDKVKMDMSSLMSQALMDQYSNMETEITGENIEFPNDPKEGQTLADGTMEIKASMGGIGNMTTTIKMINRKVEGFETVETPAGSFECVKISQETVSEVMGMSHSSKSTNWLAKGIGTVKMESYTKNGNLSLSMVLTKFEK